jgi:hypothetical protein
MHRFYSNYFLFMRIVFSFSRMVFSFGLPINIKHTLCLKKHTQGIFQPCDEQHRRHQTRGWTQVLAKGSRFLPFKILHHLVLALGNVWFIQTPMPIPSNYILRILFSFSRMVFSFGFPIDTKHTLCLKKTYTRNIPAMFAVKGFRDLR